MGRCTFLLAVAAGVGSLSGGSAAAAQGAEVCISHTTGFAHVSAAGCESGSSSPYRQASANIFNLLWSVWTPTPFPHPPHLGNMTTSLQALADFKASGLAFFRVFGSPWGAKDILATWHANPDLYWKSMEEIMDRVEELELKVHMSITPTLDQWALASNTSMRDLITNADSPARTLVKAYVTDMVTRYRNSTSVLSWGMGNELNLAADGCSYSGLPGQPTREEAYFSTAEMMVFADEYVGWIKALDSSGRPVGSDMGSPRTRAKHLSALVGKGGGACINPSNLQGDCEVNCTAVPKDSLQDYKEVLTTLTKPFDFVSVHTYGCYPPYAEFEFCNGDPTSLAALTAAKEVADGAGKPLFVGEFGSPDCVKGGWDYNHCLDYPTKLLATQAERGIQLSNAWTWCVSDQWCIDPRVNLGSAAIAKMLVATTAALNRTLG